MSVKLHCRWMSGVITIHARRMCEAMYVRGVSSRFSHSNNSLRTTQHGLERSQGMKTKKTDENLSLGIRKFNLNLNFPVQNLSFPHG